MQLFIDVYSRHKLIHNYETINTHPKTKLTNTIAKTFARNVFKQERRYSGVQSRLLGD